MANFCIFRTAKLRTDGNVASSISHALRARNTPNADTSIENWTNLNYKDEYGKSRIPENAMEQAMARYRKTLPKKIGKGRVPCVELLMTVSPEVMERKDFNPIAYLNDCDNWARDIFGNDNVFFVSHHKDETTPHTSIFLVPKVVKKYKDGHTEEILAAKQWLGGREKLSKLQDDFFEKVGKKHGLERGIKNSRAKHQTQKKYYAKINQLEKELTEFSKSLVENVPHTKGMFTEIIDKEKLDPYLKSKIESLKPYFKKLATAEDTEKKYKKLQENFDKQVEAKVNEKVASAEKSIREEFRFWEDFQNGKETKITLKDGSYVICKTGVNSIRKMNDELSDLESLTPSGVECLAKTMTNHHFETVRNAVVYARKKNISVSNIPERPTKNREWDGMEW